MLNVRHDFWYSIWLFRKKCPEVIKILTKYGVDCITFNGFCGEIGFLEGYSQSRLRLIGIARKRLPTFVFKLNVTNVFCSRKL